MTAIIAAYAHHRVIGKDGRIPWRIPGEQKQFRKLTAGHCVVMGRKTYEEIGHPLPDRMIYVVSSSVNYDEPGVKSVHSLAEALACAGEQELFIAGGQSLYEEGLELADTLYLTEIDLEAEGDRYFPELPEGIFKIIEEEHVNAEIPYRRITLKRVSFD